MSFALPLCLLSGCSNNAGQPSSSQPSGENTATAEPSPAVSDEGQPAALDYQATVAPDYGENEKIPPIVDSASPVDYSNPDMWCYLAEGDGKQADAFVIAATVYNTPEGNIVLNKDTIRREQAFINRIKGMVSDSCTIYAPSYRQMTLDSYVSDDLEEYEDYAYNDIHDAFQYYLENYHQDRRPIVLFGFSQGSILCMRLLEDFFADDSEQAKELRFDHVATYAIGAGVTEDYYEDNPTLMPAKGSDDTGVIIAFDAERPEVQDSLILPAGEEYVAINPLNWKTDGTKADAAENLGSVLVNAKGEIVSEEDAFCGAYLDDSPRHALKIDDIKEQGYDNTIPYLPLGSYHGYDISFFYRNIQANVTERVNAWYVQHVN